MYPPPAPEVLVILLTLSCPPSWFCPVLPTSLMQGGHAATDSTSLGQEFPSTASHKDTVKGRHKTSSPQWIFSVIHVGLNWVRAGDRKSNVLAFLCSRDLDLSAGWGWSSCPEAEWFKQCPTLGTALSKGACQEEVKLHPYFAPGFLDPAEWSFSYQTSHLL